MVNDLIDTFVVEVAGCVGVIRTESSIVTGGRVLSKIKEFTVRCCPVLSETQDYKI